MKREKHAQVPVRYIDDADFPLGSWVSCRRRDFKNNELAPDRVEQLESTEGWVWKLFEVKFEKGLGQLKKFVEREKHARVPSDYIDDDEFNLGKWVSHRRNNFKNNELAPDRIEQLESVKGWVWKPSEADFSIGFEQLKKFVEQEKNVQVPHDYIDNDEFNLGSWVRNRRTDFKNNELAPDRIEQLESVKGWVWKPSEADFSIGFEQLKKFADSQKHAQVPIRYIDDDEFTLGRWVQSRRKDFKDNKLAPDRIEQLESIEDWVWVANVRVNNFSTGLRQLKKFVEHEKHIRVPKGYICDDKFTLGRWIQTRRSDFKNNNLAPDRIKQLESIKGWMWDPLKADFLYGFVQLKKFVEREKHAQVPATYIDDDKFPLGSWVSNRRTAFKINKLGTDRIEQLESIEGWVWVTDNSEVNFSKGLGQLKKFVEREKHTLVPASAIGDDQFTLGSWVRSRRKDFKDNKLAIDRIEQLESIEGWVWVTDISGISFSKGLRQLKKFVEYKKHALVPLRYIDDDKFNLGSWVRSRRADFKGNKLAFDRIKQLESIEGWVWDSRKKF